jgi:hypothetical protein
MASEIASPSSAINTIDDSGWYPIKNGTAEIRSTGFVIVVIGEASALVDTFKGLALSPVEKLH